MSKQVTPRCEGCAFSKGTAANESLITQLKARLCIESEEVFYCHDQVLELFKNGLSQSAAVDLLKATDKLEVCGGWLDAVDSLTKKGYFQNQQEWKRELAQGLLGVLIRAEDTPGMTEEECGQAIREVIEQIADRESLKPIDCLEQIRVWS